MILISKATIREGESVRNVIFSNIPNIYRQLVVFGVTRDGRNTTSGLHLWGANDTHAGLMESSKTNYHERSFSFNPSAATVSTGSAKDTWLFRNYSMRNYEQANKYAFLIIDAHDYTATDRWKFFQTHTGTLTSESTPTRTGGALYYNVLEDTSAVTNINICTEQNGAFFYEYSNIWLYGIPKVNATAKRSPKAIGGQRVGTDGNYWYHAFTSSGTFQPLSGLDCDVVVIAGGGSGGISHGGGGGAGGVVYQERIRIGMPVTVTIGAGGSGAGGGRNNGNDTSFGPFITATGGGRGGVRNSATSAGNGGSGGGGGGSDAITDTAGTGTSGQGTRGGVHRNSSYTGVDAGGAGGGGAGTFGEAGQYGASKEPGVGGLGTTAYDHWGRVLHTGFEITGTSTTGYGYDVFQAKVFAGGGGAASSYSSGLSNRRSTGKHGGGDGNNSAASSPVNSGNGFAGHPATGSGGGGSWNNDAGNGGGGIVMVRYPV